MSAGTWQLVQTATMPPFQNMLSLSPLLDIISLNFQSRSIPVWGIDYPNRRDPFATNAKNASDVLNLCPELAIFRAHAVPHPKEVSARHGFSVHTIRRSGV